MNTTTNIIQLMFRMRLSLNNIKTSVGWTGVRSAVNGSPEGAGAVIKDRRGRTKTTGS